MATVTIRDVARQAGVGVGTVSRVLNSSPSVSEETRQKVLDTIEELDFSPSLIARRLSWGKTLSVAVIMPFFTRPLFVERLRGIAQALAESEYDLVLYNVETTDRRDATFREIARRERADGLLIMSLPPSDADVERFVRAGMPTVLIDAHHPRLPCAVIDDIFGGRKATQCLIELGHRRIGFVSDFLNNPFGFTSSRDRYEGYRQALAAADIPFRPDYHRQGEHGQLQSYRMARELLSLDDPPTAIFAASDTQAIGVLAAARDMELPVPDQLSVIGYDDIEIAEYLHLSTVRQPSFALGFEGAEMLVKAIDRPEYTAVEMLLPTEIVRRATTAPAPGTP